MLESPLSPYVTETDLEIWSVSELNQNIQALLEDQYPHVWVSGEISNFAAPSSGHWYFSLKDEQSQVRCVMFKPAQAGLKFIPEHGMQVLIQARVSLYTPRGDYQLIVRRLEETGTGALQRAFEQLKKRLAAEGLFLPERKKNLPLFSKCVGVVTSATGAALRDVLTVLNRRFPLLPVIVYPTSVQGKSAASEIVQAIARANEHAHCDVLLLVRGGGSLEDLWPFNEEIVARSIAASGIPIVSGVGHEVDFTIADFVADIRAPTPSAAAELISPDQIKFRLFLDESMTQLQQLILNNIQRRQQELELLKQRLPHPLQKLELFTQKLDHLEHRLHQTIQYLLSSADRHLKTSQSHLESLNPYAILERGYVMAYFESHVVDSANHLKKGDKVRLKFKDGEKDVEVC